MTIDAIVRNICSIALNEPNAQSYTRVLRALNIAIGELFYDLLPIRKSVFVPIEENLTLTLPQDCAKPTKVGVVMNGRLHLLPQNSRIRLIEHGKQCTCNCAGKPKCILHSFAVPDTTDYLPEYFGGQYRAVPDMVSEGSWSFNMAAGRIELAGGYLITPGYCLLLEYKSTTERSVFEVPDDCYLVLQYRTVQLLTSATNPNVSYSNKIQFQAEWRRLKTKYLAYSAEDWFDALKAGITDAPKI